jgi:hypothetical protein
VAVLLPEGLNLLVEGLHCLEELLQAAACVFLGLLLLPSEAVVDDADVVLAAGGDEVHHLDGVPLLEVQQFELLDF